MEDEDSVFRYLDPYHGSEALVRLQLIVQEAYIAVTLHYIVRRLQLINSPMRLWDTS